MAGPYQVELFWEGGDPEQFLYLLLLYAKVVFLFKG